MSKITSETIYLYTSYKQYHFLYVDFECANCVLQWRYIAGNNWGMCPDGTGAVGCGAQEEFRACADITIGDVGPQPPLRPMRPSGTKAPTKPTHSTTSSSAKPEAGEQPGDEPTGPRYLGPIIAALSLLVVLCVLATIYLYSYHGQRIKHLMRWNRPEKKSQSIGQQPQHQHQHIIGGKAFTPPPHPTMAPPPVPPPRTKRLSTSMAEIDANESSVLNGHQEFS